MSQVRRLEQIPAAQSIGTADQFALWQNGRTRVAQISDISDAILLSVLGAVDKQFVGLGRVDNTSDADKLLSSNVIGAALLGKAEAGLNSSIIGLSGLRQAQLKTIANLNFSEASGQLARGLIFDSSGSADTPSNFVMPSDKQFDFMGWRQTIQQTGGSKVSWLDFDLIVNGGRADAPGSPGSNAYFHIGNITNNGPGTVAGSYSRVTIGADNTGGNAIAFKGGATTRAGAGTVAGFQMSVDSYSPTKPVDYGYYLQSNDYGGFGYSPLNYGFIALKEIRIQQALVQGFNDGPGDCLRWLKPSDGSYLARIDKLGAATFTAVDVANGPTLRSDKLSMPEQGIVSLKNSAREYQIQAVSAGDYLRILVGGAASLFELRPQANSVSINIGGSLKNLQLKLGNTLTSSDSVVVAV